ncbi:MAG: hypothetical protein WD270_13885, partial [Acetobacterales bacterium]
MTLQWLTEHSSAFNVFINLGILLIWGFYLNLLVGSVRRARRCKIMISTGGRAGQKRAATPASSSRSMLANARTY